MDCGLSSFPNVTPAAAAPARGSSVTSPAPHSPPPHVESMVAELDTHCPICLDSWEEASYILPCLHQFCYTCIMRWAETKPECPLCKRRVTSILHSVWADDNFEEQVIPPPEPSVVHLTGEAPGHPAAHGLQQPAAAWPPATGPRPMAPVGGFHAYIWASIFRVHPAVLQHLLPWLHQELGQLLEDAQRAAAALRLIISSLHCFGPIEESLVRVLQTSLDRRTKSFVHQLVDTIVRPCSGEVRRQMGLEDTRAAGEQEGSPAPAPCPAASQGNSPVPSPALLEGPSSPHNAPHPTHGEREELEEDPEEAVPGLSTSSRGSQRSRGRPQQALKRRVGSPEERSQRCKKTHHHQ